LRRIVEPELADHLPGDDPRAIRFRRDLQWINVLCMTDRIMTRALRRHCASAPRAIVDLGCGDGTLMLRIARRLAPQWRNVTAILVDQQDIVSAQTREAFAALGWKVDMVAADVFDFLAQARPDVDVVTANAFLHHFKPDQLQRLFDLASQRTGLIVACEPRRSRIAREGSRFLWLIGCGDVAIYDAVASVKAGFVGTEMTQSWPGPAGWTTDEREAGPFLHTFVARRTA
jgi:SAM-dependent methyltransferase